MDKEDTERRAYAMIMWLNNTYDNRQLKNNFETNGAP